MHHECSSNVKLMLLEWIITAQAWCWQGGLRCIAPKVQLKKGVSRPSLTAVNITSRDARGVCQWWNGRGSSFQSSWQTKGPQGLICFEWHLKTNCDSFQRHYYLSVLVAKVGRAQNSKCIATGFQICGNQIWRSFMLTAQANSNVFLMRKQWCITVCGLVFRQTHRATSISCSLPTVHTLCTIIVLAYIQSPQVAGRT